MKKGLTSRQNTFAKHVASGNNATQSAILAGYSKRSARFTASKLLTNSNVLQRIEEIFKVFENVGYIGELRKRWYEIKKLLAGGAPEAMPAAMRTR